jgi:hypothetical protein
VDEEADRRLPTAVADAVQRAEALAPTLIGVGEADAISAVESAGLTFRVRRRDDTSFPLTLDFRPSRINLTIEHGTVSAIELG